MGERANYFTSLVHSSEMFCSLKYEDMGGCPYGRFTPSNIAALVTANSILAIAALLAGM